MNTQIRRIFIVIMGLFAILGLHSMGAILT